ncbi:MAG: hypothetical protein APR63_05540 [Desulfuromonas sp. SDB]|nr:MAG: hypothetical protein APR63_05540 [Desulfuromonas sp. SDB]
MGRKLMDIYALVTKHKGFKGRLRLAVRTGISQTKAQTMPDSSEAISVFERAAKEILGPDISLNNYGG